MVNLEMVNCVKIGLLASEYYKGKMPIGNDEAGSLFSSLSETTDVINTRFPWFRKIFADFRLIISLGQIGNSRPVTSLGVQLHHGF